MPLVPRWRYISDEAKALTKRTAVSALIVLLVLLVFRSLVPWVVLLVVAWSVWRALRQALPKDPLLKRPTTRRPARLRRPAAGGLSGPVGRRPSRRPARDAAIGCQPRAAGSSGPMAAWC